MFGHELYPKTEHETVYQQSRQWNYHSYHQQDETDHKTLFAFQRKTVKSTAVPLICFTAQDPFHAGNSSENKDWLCV